MTHNDLLYKLVLLLELLAIIVSSFTHKQRPLQGRRRDDDEWEVDYDSGEPHMSDLCEKCKQLGYNCRESGD